MTVYRVFMISLLFTVEHQCPWRFHLASLALSAQQKGIEMRGSVPTSPHERGSARNDLGDGLSLGDLDGAFLTLARLRPDAVLVIAKF
jgi:hypothetical protein